MKTTKTSATSGTARRGFLLGAGLAGAAGAAVVATRGGAVPASAKPQPKLDERGGGGYHVTDHVRRYYRSTLV